MREIKFRFWEPVNKWMRPWGGFDYKFVVETPVHGVLMQYTGLHDKNGKEIWEGDVVKFKDISMGNIAFEEGSFIIKTREDGGQYDLGDACWDFGDIEIIGDIYSNPELLTN